MGSRRVPRQTPASRYPHKVFGMGSLGAHERQCEMCAGQEVQYPRRLCEQHAVQRRRERARLRALRRRTGGTVRSATISPDQARSLVAALRNTEETHVALLEALDSGGLTTGVVLKQLHSGAQLRQSIQEILGPVIADVEQEDSQHASE